eukprot:2153761-Prymnesium_polylepis.1
MFGRLCALRYRQQSARAARAGPACARESLGPQCGAVGAARRSRGSSYRLKWLMAVAGRVGGTWEECCDSLELSRTAMVGSRARARADGDVC